MGDHVRKQIRAAAAALLTGLNTTGANVFVARRRALQADKLPALKIDTAGEDIQVGSMGASRLLDRSLSLTVTVCVRQLDDYANTVDAIIQEVEVAIAADNTFGGLAKYAQLTRIDIDFDDDETEVPVAEAQMNFEVVYYTAHNAPDVAL